MKTISKLKKAQKVEWDTKENGVKVENKKIVKNVKVTVTNSVEILDLINWVLALFGYDLIETLDELDSDMAEFKSLGGVCRLIASQLLQHQGSTATVAKVLEFAKGEITREELDEFVYTHDYTKVGKTKADPAMEAAKKIASLLGCSIEVALEKVKELQGITPQEDVEDDNDSDSSEDEQE